MSARRLVGSIGVVALLGCSDEDGTGTGGSGAGGAAPETFTVDFAPIVIQPGVEATQCVTKRLPVGVAFHSDQIETKLGDGTHHMFVYKSDAVEEQSTPFDCRPFGDLLTSANGAPLVIAQKREETLTLPPGVGFALDAGQMIKLEVHYINPSPEPMEVSARATFRKMEEASVVATADIAMFGQTALVLPPQSQVSTDPVTFQLPPDLAGASFFSLTGHQHELGKGMLFERLTADGESSVLYDPVDFQWAEPPTARFDPPLLLGQGEQLRLTCRFDNTTQEEVTFGESANDEMCLVYSFYFPSRGPIACAHTDLIDGGLTFCCPGHPICDQIM
jgi:hypothetical protein